MNDNFINYYAIASGINLQEDYSEQIHDSPVTEVSISQDAVDGKKVVYVKCFFGVVTDLEKIKKEANKVASLLLAKISFIYDATFGTLEFVSSFYNGNTTTSNSMITYINVIAPFDPSKLSNVNLNDDHLLLFRYANLIDIDSLKFLHLYSILDSIIKEKSKHDGQLMNDKVIYQWQLQNGITTIWKESLAPHRKIKGHPETIYTWLRNQVGHAEKNSYSNVYARITKYLPDLRDIVKWIINDYNNLTQPMFDAAHEKYENDLPILCSNIEP
jgi:hypothetical protein